MELEDGFHLHQKTTKMIDVPFIHDFFYEGFPRNFDQLLVFIENSKLDPNQKLEWSKDCLVEAKGLELKNNINYFFPLLKDFFDSLEIPIYDRNMQMTGLWTNTYTKHCFQEVHDHCPSHLSGVLFLTDEQEGDGKFYFLNKHSSEIPEPFVDMTNNTTNVFARRHFIKAERGKVLLFPSYLMHGVTVHKTDYPRRTASFNFNIL